MSYQEDVERIARQAIEEYPEQTADRFSFIRSAAWQHLGRLTRLDVVEGLDRNILDAVERLIAEKTP